MSSAYRCAPGCPPRPLQDHASPRWGWRIGALVACLVALASCGDPNAGRDGDGLNLDANNSLDNGLVGTDDVILAEDATPDVLPDTATCTVATESCNGLDDDCDGLTDEDLCDDKNPCTTEQCDAKAGSGLPGTCTATAVEGTCDDANPCTVGDFCAGGVCTGKPAPCDDDNPCTADVCNASSGSCEHPAIAGPCDDGNTCTVGEACDSGVCAGGKTIDCSDKNPCTDDTCDVAGGCQHANNTAGCDDGEACTKDDVCGGGACLPGAASPCDDQNACTQDACELAKGCTHTDVEGGCDDGDPCTIADACKAGQCGGAVKDCDDANPCTLDTCGPAGCSHKAKAENAACEDGDSCTQGDLCDHDGKCSGKAVQCDDGNPCTLDVCTQVDGKCHPEPTSGPACEDGDGCTLGDACFQGDCVGGTVKVCSDANPCTDDACNKISGACVFQANQAPCDDSDACTTGDTCAATLCKAGTATACDDGDPCTIEKCNTATGKCDTGPVVDGVACSDGVACTQGDACTGGKCIPGSQPQCDDGNLCTTDGCDAVTGKCVSTNQDGVKCEDGNPCTTGDSCSAGKCASGTNNCSCQTDLDCAKSEDGNLCNGTLYCDTSKPGQYQCKVDLKTLVVCDTSKDTECSTWACKPTSGKCEPTNNLDSTPCDADKSVCSKGDHCLAGLCVPGAQTDCDDKSGCTNDSCDPLNGCVHAPNSAPCEDGNPCTKNDTCGNGVCGGGPALSCDDGDPCTSDYCDQVTGKCAAKPLSGGACTDGNPCTLNDSCVGGLCQPAAVKACDDGNSCTQDLCDPGTGACATKPIADKASCEDGSPCTLNDTCLSGKCSPGIPKNCDDGNVCTTDSCDPKLECMHKAALDGQQCSDGDACSVLDTCKNGGCVSGAPKVCVDQACATATCDPSSGQCVAKANSIPCDDGNACSTGDVCTGGVCIAPTYTKCDDGNPCTEDACDALTGKCSFLSNSAPCDDGNTCTKLDQCKGGTCGGVILNCNDGNPCTTDSCDASKGCVHVATAAQPCDDGSICTVGDTCVNGGCKGTGITCGDGNPCTSDSCDPVKGCQFSPNTGACSDGNACTVGDSCATGKCVPGKPSLCDDGKPCTDDVCNPGDGSCKYGANDKSPCSDGNPCSADDHCAGGACTGGAVQVNCDDKNGCTADTCDPGKGCVHLPNPAAPCTDGNACTYIDVCVNGKCVSGEPTNCNDGNPCTTDSCDASTGCTHGNTTLPCDDGDACQGPDQCSGGKCVAAAKIGCDDKNVCTVDTCDAVKGCQHTPAASSGSTTTTVVSDTSTQVSTEATFVNGQEVFQNFAAAVAVQPVPSAFPSIPGASWMWANVAEPPPGQSISAEFRRTFDLTTLGQMDGTLTVGANNQLLCWVNEKLVIGSFANATYKSPLTIALKGLLKNGSNLLRCQVNHQTAEGSLPGAIAFKLEATVYTSGAPCDDGNPCTTGDSCFGGTCVGPSGPQCDDGNPCTTDVCSLSGGCSHSNADGAACDDGNFCTGGDKCSAGKCAATGPADCSDGNICATTACNPSLGCTHQPATTGKFTTASTPSDNQTTFIAADGSKKAAVPTWDAFNGWTHAIAGATWLWSSQLVDKPDTTQQVQFTRVFTIAAGAVKYTGTLTIATDGAFVCMMNGVLTGVETDEANYATPLVLNISGSIQAGTNTLLCTVVNPGKAGSTANTNPAGLLFRIDINSYPVGATTSCDDGNACTTGDFCIGQKCENGTVTNCDDNNGCTADYCDPVKGCGHSANQALLCDDGNPCTVSDACKDGSCAGGPGADCSDNNACTTDTCDGKTGCAHSNADGKTCDDNNACTGQDTCKGGKCLALSGSPCDDGNPCTLDGCDPVNGCYHSVDNGATCTDGNECTVGDSCSGGQCVGKSQNACDDGDVCTNDTCDGAKGCAHTALDGGKCEDGDACTTGDTCKSGACASGGLKACTDGQPCTTDGCDAKSGACKFTPLLSGPCEDGNLCTNNDTCSSGQCAAGKARDCSDANPCTLDSCDPATGNCLHEAGQNGAGCDDGDACTTVDACTQGKCLGQNKSCDDGNPCTSDTCDHTSGKCLSKVLADGTACGSAGTCFQGVCK
jgi:hypothetical protein